MHLALIYWLVGQTLVFEVYNGKNVKTPETHIQQIISFHCPVTY